MHSLTSAINTTYQTPVTRPALHRLIRTGDIAQGWVAYTGLLAAETTPSRATTPEQEVSGSLLQVADRRAERRTAAPSRRVLEAAPKGPGQRLYGAAAPGRDRGAPHSPIRSTRSGMGVRRERPGLVCSTPLSRGPAAARKTRCPRGRP